VLVALIELRPWGYNPNIKINVVYNDVFCTGCASSWNEQIFGVQLYEFIEILSANFAANWLFEEGQIYETGTKR
jgi:hypothetical protein